MTETTTAGKQRECCDYCMWYGPVNKNGTMRKHRPATQEDKWGRPNQVQDMNADHCEGSHKPYATFGCDVSQATETPRVGERVTYKVGRWTANATVTRPGVNEDGHVSVVDDGDQTGRVRYVLPSQLTVQAPDLDALHGDALAENELRTSFRETVQTPGAETVPWTISETDHTVRTNTGHDWQWECRVDGCTQGCTSVSDSGAVRLAAQHSASHTETELASTGYRVRFNYAAAAAAILASEASPEPVTKVAQPVATETAEVTEGERTVLIQKRRGGDLMGRVVTVKGKDYVLAELTPANRPIHAGAPKGWKPTAYVRYWSVRDGERFGATRTAGPEAKPGSVGHTLFHNALDHVNGECVR